MINQHNKVALALFEPDIPQNTGSLLRLSACLEVTLHIIEPTGYPFDDKRLRRVAMDYFDVGKMVRHQSWQAFLETVQPDQRIVLLSAHARLDYSRFEFRPNDILLLGRESAGVPDMVKQRADAKVTIKLSPKTRSLNVTLAAAMVLGEALRQTDQFPVAA